MSTRIEVQPDTAAEIGARARVEGVSVDAYLRILLAGTGRPSRASSTTGRASLDDFKAMLDALAIDKPEDTFPIYQGTYSREDIYLDHD